MSATSLSRRADRDGRFVWTARPARVQALIARDWRITRTYRTALITDLGFGFLNLIVYFYISKTLRGSSHRGFDGAPSYFAFAAVGVALAVVLQAAVMGVSRRLREEQLTGTLEALLVQPVSSSELALGLAGFPFLLAVARAFLYLVLAGLFLGLSFQHADVPALIASFTVSGVAFAALGIGVAALVMVFKRADSVGTLGAFGLSLLGGAFFPIAALPHWLRAISNLIPTRYAFAAVRAAMFGVHDWAGPLLALAVLGAVTMAITLVLFGVAVRHAIGRGTVGQY